VGKLKMLRARFGAAQQPTFNSQHHTQ